MKHYESKSAMCPFYHSEEKQKIHCEGILPYTTIHMAFMSQADLRKHKQKYCHCMDYDKCPIADMLNRKYDKKSRFPS